MNGRWLGLRPRAICAVFSSYLLQRSGPTGLSREAVQENLMIMYTLRRTEEVLVQRASVREAAGINWVADSPLATKDCR